MKGVCEFIFNFVVWKLIRSVIFSWIGFKVLLEWEVVKSGEVYVDRFMVIGGCWFGYRMFRLVGYVCWVGCWLCVVK